MSRRELREQIFKLLFRVEFNTPEDMPEQEAFSLRRRMPQRERMPGIFRTSIIGFARSFRR